MAYTKLNKWDQRFMSMAYNEVRTWSKDPDKKVGAVIVAPSRRHFSPGFNGFPSSIADTPERLNNKELKRRLTVHAEVNAIRNFQGDVTNWSLYVTSPPCTPCALEIIQAGISRVVCPSPSDKSSWYECQQRAICALLEAGVKVETTGCVEENIYNWLYWLKHNAQH